MNVAAALMLSLAAAGLAPEGETRNSSRDAAFPVDHSIATMPSPRLITDILVVGTATNYVAHPVSWGLLGLYLKERGYSSAWAILFTQAHSVLWEYVIEGSYMKPSGKDLLANVVGATLGIYALHGLSERAAQREAKRFYDYLLARLNPLRLTRSLLRPDGAVSVSLEPSSPPGDGIGLRLALSW